MRFLNRVFYFFTYLLKAGNEHRVHSPFVFNLLLKVFYNKNSYYSYTVAENLRQLYLRSDQSISCLDLGADSQGVVKKRISDIAAKSLASPKHAQLLFRLINYFQPPNILELGTSLGVSTLYMALAKRNSQITTIEGCEQLSKLAQESLIANSISDVTFLKGNFDHVLPEFLSSVEQLSFVFFDGNHRYKPTMSYFSQCLDKATDSSVFIFDDIYWSPEMKQAWLEIKQHPRVTVTIDIFQMGIVFFRKEQVKEHFMIRYFLPLFLTFAQINF